jgi:phosphotransferase system enzyme I (PtsI)
MKTMAKDKETKKAEPKKEVVLFRGIGVSSGIVIGKAHLIINAKEDAVQFGHIDSTLVDAELERFSKALIKSIEQLQSIKKKLSAEGGGKEHIGIIDAHEMMLNDEMLIEDTKRLIKDKKMNVEWALNTVLKDITELFGRMDDEYLKERSSDIGHIVDRILLNLSGGKRAGLSDITEPSIVVAHDLSPTDTAEMVKTKVLGFLTDIGGRTSHTAIMARSLEMPAVVGLEDITANVKTGDTLIVDGMTGAVIVNPSENVKKVYEKRKKRYLKYDKALHHYRDLPAETRDGQKISLMGNIELVDEVGSLLEHGAEGIGLYRSEFLYLNRKELPTEAEHIAAYKHVAKKAAPYPVVVRTLDIGGDKLLDNVSPIDETNPAMGLRAIRLCLKRTDIFRTQLRGILRASAYGKLKILIPMLSGIDELRRAKALIEEAKAELREEGKDFDDAIQVGSMIEVPSAALIADLFAKESDFLSIGTNDLLQYSLAIDRVNEHVAYLYEPFHPAVLRMIKGVVDAAREQNISVSVCGEMAGEPEHAVIFLGMGLDKLSMSAYSLLRVKRIIRAVSFEEAKNISSEALKFSTAREVESFVTARLKDYYEDEF